jgi:hypothetical protein
MANQLAPFFFGDVTVVATIFGIKAVREPTEFLGIQVSCYHTAGTISLSQETKAMELACRLNVATTRHAIPMSPEIYSGLQGIQISEQATDQTRRGQVLWSLLHREHFPKPDLAVPVNARVVQSLWTEFTEIQLYP